MKLMQAIYERYLLDNLMVAAFTLHDTEAPDKTPYPYATYQLSIADFDFNMMQIFEDCVLQFDLYSDEKSPVQIEDMFDALRGVPVNGTGFDFYDLPVEDFATIIMKRETATKTREKNIWHYTVLYRILLEYTGVGTGVHFHSNLYSLMGIFY